MVGSQGMFGSRLRCLGEGAVFEVTMGSFIRWFGFGLCMCMVRVCFFTWVTHRFYVRGAIRWC